MSLYEYRKLKFICEQKEGYVIRIGRFAWAYYLGAALFVAAVLVVCGIYGRNRREQRHKKQATAQTEPAGRQGNEEAKPGAAAPAEAQEDVETIPTDR